MDFKCDELISEKTDADSRALTTATNKNALYDSYIRAIRWASDRVGECGIIGFVTNAGFIEANTANGMRKCLAEEFANIWIFHLRGNQRTQGELSRKEGGKIFGSGSRAPIAITLLVKNPDAKEHGKIYFHDIGDYLSQEEKLNKISKFGNIAGITDVSGWVDVIPDQYNDWLNQRDDGFSDFIVMGDKKTEDVCLFKNYSNGVKTQRDTWCYNSSKTDLASNMERMIANYNKEVNQLHEIHPNLNSQELSLLVDDFISFDPTKISWTRALKGDLIKGRKYYYESSCLTQSLYRPYTKQWLYFNRRFNEMVYQIPKIFPNKITKNIVIQINAKYREGQIALISNVLPDLHCNGDSQCLTLIHK